MKITTIDQAESFQSIVGAQNTNAMKKALEDGAEMYIFRTKEEIEASELSEEEKQSCINLLKDNEGRFAGWVRPKPKYVPGFGPYSTRDGYYSTHGDWKVSNSGNHTGPCH